MNTSIFKQVPSNPDSTKRYLFYLHGLIVEEAGIRPKSEEHGYYEYELILEKLVEEGFIVISEVRAQGTQVQPYAENIVSQIKTLLDNNVSPSDIIPKWAVCDIFPLSDFEKILETISQDLLPETLITEIAPIPLAVASAQIVSWLTIDAKITHLTLEQYEIESKFNVCTVICI